MKKVTIRTRKQVLIPSGYLVHALARAGRRYNCRNCGDRMFVRYESGLCPLCFNGRRPVKLPSSASFPSADSIRRRNVAIL